eukprot:gnl/TRDRNA2_/TRDRNA2_178008_c1_seq15.p1 gnl/TRDRNA2_/TRDRNA2_178008_c1~~gnl/TRDRNA2_/TRDRNA2_178008_c1_seq15.p1  ORF type:complete len:616 (+),score=116.48 gnl/TRDRNA2_/TRDRNA2_178008_c1_seq15:133-1848(+)
MPAPHSPGLSPQLSPSFRTNLRYQAGAKVSAPAVMTAAASAATAEVEVNYFKKQDELSVAAATGKAAEFSGDALVVMLWGRPEGEEGSISELFEADTSAIDAAMSSAISELISAEDFKAEAGSSVSARLLGQAVNHLVLVGLGPKPDGDKVKKVDWRQVGSIAAEAVSGKLKGSRTTGIASLVDADLEPLVEGLLLGSHKDDRFKGKQTTEKDRQPKGPSSIELFVDAGVSSDDVVAAIDTAKSVVSGVVFARELVNAPANVLTPPALAEAASVMGKQLGLETTILDESECEKMGMGAFLGVGRASNLNSKLIHLVYRPEGEVTRKIGIVGKGLTFDSGGYNIKMAMMEKMKFDMGGSAATLGTAAAVAQLKPKGVEVHFVIATCENMVSGNEGALRPGDIIKAMDGTTIEVGNTDAEGRLTLADAMLYAQQQGVTEMVEISTLTGACMVALGTEIAGFWSGSDSLAKHLQDSSELAGEPLWRMPLHKSYVKGLKSDLADVKNIAGPYGGAITAALFLEKFVNKTVDWAHIDIAGPVWTDTPTPLCTGGGGTGAFVRTLTNFASTPYADPK